MSFICHIHNYTEYNQQWNVFSAFNPSKCSHTWSSGEPTLRRLGSSWGFGALLNGLTSVEDTSCQSRDSNPQPWVTSGFKSNALSIRPRLPHNSHSISWNRCVQHGNENILAAEPQLAETTGVKQVTSWKEVILVSHQLLCSSSMEGNRWKTGHLE